MHHADLRRARNQLSTRRRASARSGRGRRPGSGCRRSRAARPIVCLELLRLLSVSQTRLLRPHEPGEARHHVHLDVAVEQEVAAELVFLGVLRPVLRVLGLLDLRRQQQHRRRLGLDDERLGRARCCGRRWSRCANCHRLPCRWKLCQPMPRSRLKTYQRIRWPAWATIVGLLPMNARPLKQVLGIPAPSSVTVWVSCRASSAPCRRAAPSPRRDRSAC